MKVDHQTRGKRRTGRLLKKSLSFCAPLQSQCRRCRECRNFSVTHKPNTHKSQTNKRKVEASKAKAHVLLEMHLSAAAAVAAAGSSCFVFECNAGKFCIRFGAGHCKSRFMNIVNVIHRQPPLFNTLPGIQSKILLRPSN